MTIEEAFKSLPEEIRLRHNMRLQAASKSMSVHADNISCFIDEMDGIRFSDDPHYYVLRNNSAGFFFHKRSNHMLIVIYDRFDLKENIMSF